jgi:uncharacterized membrane protein YkoI
MSTVRVLAILLALIAGLEAAAIQGASGAQAGAAMAQADEEVIAPSMALRIALRYSPGSQGLDVTLVQGGRPMYAVKLKTGNRVQRVLVDARTGQILGE